MADRRYDRRAGLSIRNRLAVTYTVLLVVTGLAMILAVNVTTRLMNGALIDMLYVVAIITVVLIALLGAVASWLVAGWMLRPLQRLNTVVRHVDETSLGTRLRLSGPNDEIRSLADTFDVMFARLETAFASRALFAANASHELRTPLATMKTILQVALRGEPGSLPPETRETYERLLVTVESMAATTTALLELAQGRTGITDDVESVDLADVVSEELAVVDDEIAARRLVIVRDLSRAPVSGDPGLLHNLVGNLLRNAVLHNREHGYLGVSTAIEAGGRVRLVVENSGDVIPAERLAQLTEPFYRARLRTTGGHGLGLAIVAAIADAHGAELRLGSRAPDGLTVAVTFASPS